MSSRMLHQPLHRYVHAGSSLLVSRRGSAERERTLRSTFRIAPTARTLRPTMVSPDFLDTLQRTFDDKSGTAATERCREDVEKD